MSKVLVLLFFGHSICETLPLTRNFPKLAKLLTNTLALWHDLLKFSKLKAFISSQIIFDRLLQIF